MFKRSKHSDLSIMCILSDSKVQLQQPQQSQLQQPQMQQPQMQQSQLQQQQLQQTTSAIQVRPFAKNLLVAVYAGHSRRNITDFKNVFHVIGDVRRC